MNIEDVERRFAKGYDLTWNEDIVQWQNDTEWLMDRVLILECKYRNLLNAINDAIEENNKS